MKMTNDVKTTLVDKFGSATYLHDTETSTMGGEASSE